MNKENFIKIIGDIYSGFSNSNNKFEIPLENIDDINDQINIIVPNTFSEPKILDLCDKIGLENGLFTIDRSDKILSITYSKFRINFIKTFDDLIKYSFMYNSFNVFKELVTILFENIKLKYSDIGLFYCNDGYQVLLSDDYVDIVSFLGIDSKHIFKQGVTYEELFNMIISSPFFDSRNFTYDIVSKIENYPRYTELYNKFILYAKNQKTYTNRKFDSLYMYELDLFFPESELLEKISKNMIDKHKDSFIRNEPPTPSKSKKLKKLDDKSKETPKIEITKPPKRSKNFSFLNSAKNLFNKKKEL